MCGIAIIWDKKGGGDQFSAMGRMLEVLHHRGPDAHGQVSYPLGRGTLYLGNTRLKVLDLEDRANQPMASACGKYVLVFNGEIYNYRELRKQLPSNATLTTQSDTEVLLNWLIHKGKQGIAELNGMFAFAFYDNSKQELLLARDASGIKPLYYALTDDGLVAASELKALFASGRVVRKFNAAQLPNYLAFKHVRKPLTFFEQVYELPEGHCLTLNNQGMYEMQPWNQAVNNKLEMLSPAALADRVDVLLSRALELQCRTDVPLGLFLSGGIDSTLLLAKLKELGKTDVPCFTVVPGADTHKGATADAYYAKLAAKQYGGEYIPLSLDAQSLEELPGLLATMDQPIGDGAFFLTWMLSSLARSKVKVALSGAGADEWFAGYNRHRAFRFYLKYLSGRKGRIALLKALPNRFYASRLATKFLLALEADPVKTYRKFCSLHLPEAWTAGADFEMPKGLDWMNSALAYDRHQYLISDILMLTDQASMLRSLEVRVPYLDKDLTAFIQAQRSECLFTGGTKGILKTLLERKGGKVYTQRRKEGFGLPIGQWMREGKDHQMHPVLQNSGSRIFAHIPFDQTQLEIKKHISGKEDKTSELVALGILALWMEVHQL